MYFVVYQSRELHCTFALLFNAEILSAGDNAFSGTIPEEISGLTNLREILLELNFLSGSIPENIGEAKALGRILRQSKLIEQDLNDIGLTNYS